MPSRSWKVFAAIGCCLSATPVEAQNVTGAIETVAYGSWRIEVSAANQSVALIGISKNDNNFEIRLQCWTGKDKSKILYFPVYQAKNKLPDLFHLAIWSDTTEPTEILAANIDHKISATMYRPSGENDKFFERDAPLKFEAALVGAAGTLGLSFGGVTFDFNAQHLQAALKRYQRGCSI